MSSNIMRSIHEGKVNNAVEAMKDEVDESGIGALHPLFAGVADRLADLAATRAGHARADMLRLVSLLSEAAEIVEPYNQ